MVFKIVVCIKQVPDTSDIRWTEHNTIQREGLDSIINPYDIGAIQLAKNTKFLLSKQNINAEITAVSMGPLQACDALKSAIAMGCDSAVLLSDKKFSGADTLATAYTLSQFIKIKIPDYKLILCGQQAIDGDTAQTPSSLAQKLSIAQITNVISLKEANETYSIWRTETVSMSRDAKTGYPVLIAASQKDNDILPDINGYIKAQDTPVTILNAENLNADFDKIGLSGSPTRVKNAYKAEMLRNVSIIENASTDDCSGYILNEISKCKVKNDR